MDHARLEEVPEAAAVGRTAEIYKDIRATLRTTQVGLLFRTLAVHQAYFEATWATLRPNASISYFERCADGLRMRTIPPLPSDVPDHEEELEGLGYSEDQVAEIAGVIEVYNYVLPKELMLAAALKGSLNGLKIGDVKPGFEEDLRPLSEGPPSSMRTPRLADPSLAEGETAGMFGDLQKRFGSEFVADLWRALGHFPDYLELVLPFLEEEMAKKGFEITVSLSQGAAGAAAQEFPFPVDLSRERALETGCAGEELDGIDRKIDHLIHLIPRTHTALLFLKAAVVGEGRVRHIPFEGE